MNLIPYNCPNCGAALEIPEGSGTTKCKYCGGTFEIPESKDEREKSRLKTFLLLAQKAFMAENYDEAHTYYNKAIEIDTENPYGWYGKGLSVAMMATLDNFRYSEIFSSFETAIALSPEEEAEEVRTNAADIIGTKSGLFYKFTRNHLLEYICLDGAYHEYMTRCVEIVEALDKAHTWAPRNKEILENLVEIHVDIIQGVVYEDEHDTDERGKPKKKRYSIEEDGKNVFRRDLNKYIEAIKQIDPEYSPPQISRTTGGGGTIKAFLLVAVILAVIIYLLYQSGTLGSKEKESNETGTTENVNVVVFTTNCSLRSGPSTENETIGYVRPDKEYELITTRGTWKKIRLNDGKEGWASCKTR